MKREQIFRLLTSSSIFTTLVLLGWFMNSDQSELPLLFAHVAALFLGFWLPAQRLEVPCSLRKHWKRVLLHGFAATLVWDVLSAFWTNSRPFFSEWYLVYTSGPLFMLFLMWINVRITNGLLKKQKDGVSTV